jgi:hypothetical protein
MLGQIASKIDVPVLLEVTKPGLVGTIDNKTLQLIPGAAWECRNNLMLIDEFNVSKKNDSWEAFLQLLEQQEWSKRFGMFSASLQENDNDLFVHVDKGKIDLRTRFSCIIATMKDFRFMRGQKFRALITRTIPYNFVLSEEELDMVADGHEFFVLDKKFNGDFVDEFIVKRKKYLWIKGIVKNTLKNECNSRIIRSELFLRTIGDCCRLFASSQKKLEKKDFETVVKWKINAQQKIGEYYKTKKSVTDK